MSSTRQQKFSRQLLKDLSEIFQKDPRGYFGNSLVTLTGVEMSPDLSFAKLFLSVFPVKDADTVFFQLNEKKSEIRKHLGNKIGKRVRIIPQIAFFHDDTQEQASKMDQLIASLNITKGGNTGSESDQ